ncbi:hypothetical protein CONLIGDRAFT_687769 [Coniochaeta ligniaria NRRL 30616]|uniref:Integrase catalytic domain-containing protein n=1 Tax=Coniochaeta ligniaria NRRL 30616 TaxID=1408157 RepID=A0A1J7I3Y8_9PEZI|nr:hypothetical protein CONLIGDRAFT_687769 [Coniochaeta ligniaria NRRL 30616]
MNAARPARFKFTLHDDCEFSYEVIVDIMYLDGNRPVLNLVDTATSFNAARLLRDRTSKHEMGLSIKEVPIEAHNSIGKVERYHRLLRRAYKILRDEAVRLASAQVSYRKPK